MRQRQVDILPARAALLASGATTAAANIDVFPVGRRSRAAPNSVNI